MDSQFKELVVEVAQEAPTGSISTVETISANLIREISANQLVTSMSLTAGAI